MTDHQVDLLVIGAGASGASVAYEAIRRGLSVALLEAGDIGGGTSCRSTKLLHGGVRYLELAFKTLDLAQLQLVREALLERGHWLRAAPFLAQRLELGGLLAARGLLLVTADRGIGGGGDDLGCDGRGAGLGASLGGLAQGQMRADSLRGDEGVDHVRVSGERPGSGDDDGAS